MEDDVPDKAKNNRWGAISNGRSIDAKQLHLGDKRQKNYNIVFQTGMHFNVL